MPASSNSVRKSDSTAESLSDQSGESAPSLSVASVPLPQENNSPEALNGSGREGILGRFKKILGIKNGSIRQDLQFALSDDSFDDGHFSADERMFWRCAMCG